MSDRYVEKSFLYLILLSVLLHVALFTAVLYLVPKAKPPVQEPQMLDLNDLTELAPAPPAPKKEMETKRQGVERRRVPKETAPKGESEVGRAVPHRALSLPGPSPLPRPPRATARPAAPRTAPPAAATPGPGLPAPAPERSAGEVPRGEAQRAPRGDGLFKPRTEQGDSGKLAKLFPDSRSLARTEDSYRKKYGPEVEEGNATFLNTNDVQFGSFFHRFENALYGVWHYPQAAAELGQQGVSVVKITFNKEGEMVKTDLLESSGSKILDREILRTLRMMGPMGSLPKGYQKETFSFIGFFEYTIRRTVIVR